MIRSDDALPFNERTAERLIKIAKHPVLTDPTHLMSSILPTAWTTLYELSKTPPKLQIRPSSKPRLPGWLRAQRPCLENPNMVTPGLRLARA